MSEYNAKNCAAEVVRKTVIRGYGINVFNVDVRSLSHSLRSFLNLRDVSKFVFIDGDGMVGYVLVVFFGVVPVFAGGFCFYGIVFFHEKTS